MKRLCVLLIAISMVIPTFALADDPGVTPDHVHFSWQSDPSTTLTAVWRTNAATLGSVMEYGIGGLTDSVNGEWFSYSGGHGILHKAEITGLDPNTVYHVRVGDGAGNWSGTQQIVTAPLPTDSCEPFSFVILGDSRATIGDGASTWWSTMLDVATDQVPDFILFNGDATKEGDVQDGWDDWFAPGDLSSQPLMPAWGNHEDRGDSKYIQQHVLPVNDRTYTEDFYSFRYGNSLFLSLDSEHGTLHYGLQQAWLGDQLGKTDAIWKFAFIHRPPYSSGTTHGSEPEVQEYLVPVFDQYHVDVAFGSHDHMYERTVPIKDDEETSEAEGTVYFVTGGAGAFVNPIGGFAWFSEKFFGIMHVILVEVNFDKATFTCKDVSEIVWDEYTIHKPGIGAPIAAFTMNPIPAAAGQPVTFDGSSSVDPCDEVVDYHWQFGDGDEALGQVVEHTYDQPGSVTVVLTVTDSDLQTGETSQDLDILENPDDDDDDDDDDDSGDDDDDSGGDDDDDDDSGECCG